LTPTSPGSVPDFRLEKGERARKKSLQAKARRR
jgi:hypothetical protein